MAILGVELLTRLPLPLVVPVTASLLAFLYLAGFAIYNVYFHPLSKFPGPKLASISGIPYMYAVATGRVSFWAEALHERYGEVVRISPTELSFISPGAWKDIYGYHPGRDVCRKDTRYYFLPEGGIHNLLTAPDAEHTRMRRILEPAFSTKALKAMDPVLTTYGDRLVSRLHDQLPNSDKGTVDILRWYNWTTFDLTGDLTFGQSFGCLENADYHPWISLIFNSLKIVPLLTICQRSPTLFKLLEVFIPASLRQQRIDHHQFSVKRTNDRLAIDTDRPDFITQIQQGVREKGVSLEEIQSNSAVLLVAGSETTASLLSGTTFHLLMNPDKLEKLVHEIRNSFTSDKDINTASTATLPYLSAVLLEGLRVYPPVPTALPRTTPTAGVTIDGHWVPGNFGVSIAQWTAYRWAHYFAESRAFIPERWLADTRDARFENDRRDVVQPFSIGLRNCIGKNLANAMTRIILAKTLYNFDLSFPLGNEQRDWADQKMFTVWQKEPLLVKLTSIS